MLTNMWAIVAAINPVSAFLLDALVDEAQN
jgi:hypothetical protein